MLYYNKLNNNGVIKPILGPICGKTGCQFYSKGSRMCNECIKTVHVSITKISTVR